MAIIVVAILVHSRSCKSKRHNDWFQSSAKAMDLILDESLYPPLVMSFLVSIIKPLS